LSKLGESFLSELTLNFKFDFADLDLHTSEAAPQRWEYFSHPSSGVMTNPA